MTFIESLRTLADFYETHPDLPVPSDVTIRVYCLDTPEEVDRVARLLAPCEKQVNPHDMGAGALLYLTRRFNELTLSFIFLRKTVCVRRVVGTENVPAQVIPAYTRETVEWDCEPVLKELLW